MNENFFVKKIRNKYDHIYFENFNDAFYYARWCGCSCEIWHCSKYLDECKRLTTIKIKYYEL
jgi:hypothetical protein